MRHGDTRRAHLELTDKMLTLRLRDVDEPGLVERVRLPRAQVSYDLTEKGHSLTPVMQSLQEEEARSAGRSMRASLSLGQFVASLWAAISVSDDGLILGRPRIARSSATEPTLSRSSCS
jgi:hypothetical protein